MKLKGITECYRYSDDEGFPTERVRSASRLILESDIVEIEFQREIARRLIRKLANTKIAGDPCRILRDLRKEARDLVQGWEGA